MSSSLDDAKTIFLQALEIEAPDERLSFIQSKCGDDGALQDEVQRLLGHHDGVGSFLESPPVSPDSDPTLEQITESPGDQIGPYKLREVIGEGGMGIVFVAEQQKPLRRKVALKVIKPGMDSKAVLARFDAERQALALMDHPNIAKVHDAGKTRSGRPYFVMELIQGQAITEYSDEKRLTVRQRLELFTDVCKAVQHAHQKGIIHRDIKPNNVLITEIDGKPVAKVIDFGVAKALSANLTEHTLYTSFQALVGTPTYMSPEQAKLSGVDVDTRSDVYSLGVLLYELLTGDLPFDRDRLKQAALDEVCRIIREEEPPSLSARISTLGNAVSDVSVNRSTEPAKLARTLRHELTWIAGMAMEKDRGRRYQSPAALVEDIENHLQDLPIRAGRPSRVAKVRRYARRHWKVLCVAAAFLLVAGYSSWQASQLKRTLDDNKRALVGRAEEAILNANFRTALELLRDIDDEDASLDRTLQGIARFYLGHYAEAQIDLRQAYEQNTEDIKSIAMLSVVQHFMQDEGLAAGYRRQAFSKRHLARSSLEKVCLAQAQVLDNRAPQIEEVLFQRYEEETKPLVSVVFAHVLGHRAFEWDRRNGDETEAVRESLAKARDLVASAKKVTEGSHFFDLIDLFVRLMEMHILKHIGEPNWNAMEAETDVLADRLVNDDPSCEISIAIAAEYFRLTKSDLALVEKAYERIAEIGGTRYKSVCMRAARGEAVDWNQLAESSHLDDRLAAWALSSELEIRLIDPAIGRDESLHLVSLVSAHLARRETATAKRIASNYLTSSRAITDIESGSASHSRFSRLFFRNLEGELSDQGFIRGTGWPLQAKYRLGLKYYAMGDWDTARQYLQDVVDSGEFQVYVNERAHWAAVLLRRIPENSENR